MLLHRSEPLLAHLILFGLETLTSPRVIAVLYTKEQVHADCFIELLMN